jgi:hypothetical protein
LLSRHCSDIGFFACACICVDLDGTGRVIQLPPECSSIGFSLDDNARVDFCIHLHMCTNNAVSFYSYM